MSGEAKLTLRERAALAWQQTSAKRRLWADELQREVEEKFGIDCEVKIIHTQLRPEAHVNDLRFVLGRYGEGGVRQSKQLKLLQQCPQCQRDAEIDIDGLEDLGAYLEFLEFLADAPDFFCRKTFHNLSKEAAAKTSVATAAEQSTSV